MRRRSKREFDKGLAVLLLVSCISMTGCGGEYAGVNRAVSDSAVSGSAVSGGAVSENAVRGASDEDKNTENSQKTAHTDANQYYYSTDTNVYYEDYDDNQECIVQARFDGSHKEKIVTAGDENGDDLYLDYVDGNWLYYELDREDDAILYRIPLKKDGKGYDVAKISEEEEVLRTYCVCSALWSSREVLFDNGDGRVIRFDLQKKKTVSEWNYADMGIDMDSEINLFRLKDRFVALTEEGVYATKVGGTQWKKCKDSEKCVWEEGDSYIYTKNSLFYAEDEAGDDEIRAKIRIKKCDGEAIQTFVTQEQMLQAAKRAKQIRTESQIKECDFNDMYAQDDRLYIQYELHWKEDEVYRMEYVIFSQGENETELRFEKELTECMQSHVKSRKGRLESYVPDVHTSTPKKRTVMEKHAVVNDAQCVAMLNGKAYLSLYDYEKNKGRMGCYELSTGKFRWVTKKEAFYGELRRSGLDRDEVFETEDDNPYVVFEGGGFFVEEE